ncbi:MAG: ATP-binding protein, partial [Rikenellaceae bacterium]|nr:ATP-binding protein [Rikenellaceae bacterium]
CLIDCSEYNLFCGQNDVGKSNVLKALNLFFNQKTDFETPFNFSVDYNKYSLAEAQSSKKKKQLIKVKITFQTPASYKSINSSEFFIEKTFDRNDKTGIGTIRYSEESTQARSAISRILNQIRFVYIPALKGKEVIQYLLGLLGEQQLIQNAQIEDLNRSINATTGDLSDLLNESNIAIGATFGLPTLLSDFWRQLAVGTNYEYTRIIEEDISNRRGTTINLNPSYYQIPLTMRGDGIKSKFLPPILKWLQNHNKHQTFIWGIDEPENSLEFRAAEALSTLFCDEYASTTQIFATSHSMAFINPRESGRIQPKIFRAGRSKHGDTIFTDINDLLKESNKEDLLEEIGSLAIQKELISYFRQKIDDEKTAKDQLMHTLNEMHNKLSSLTKPLLITEGKTDWKHIKKALQHFQSMREYTDINVEIWEYDDELGDSKLDALLTNNARVRNASKIIGLFDCDQNGNKSIIGYRIAKEGGIKEYGNNVYGCCIVTPDFRSYLSKGISVEFMYPDEVIKQEDTNGRRLFLSSEFNKAGRLSSNAEIGVLNYRLVTTCLDHDSEKIIDQEVFDIHGQSLALSKEAFAQHIFDATENFTDINFDGFRQTFDRLRHLLSKE